MVARQRKEEYIEVTACKKARRESSLGTENRRLFKTCRAVGRVCVGVKAAASRAHRLRQALG